MKYFKALIIGSILLLIFKQADYCNCTVILSPIHGAYIYDLFGVLILQALALQWTINGKADPNLSGIFPCSSMTIFGQPGFLNNDGYFERTYYLSTIHSFLTFQFRAYIIDAWITTDYYEIQFDNVPVLRVYPEYKKSLGAFDICANGAYSGSSYVQFGRVLHSSSTLTVKIISHVSNSPSNAWFAIKDLYIFMRNDTSSGLLKCSGGNYITDECPCAWNKYYNSTTSPSCTTCDAACATCFGPTDADCYSCASGKSFDGIRCKDSDTSNCNLFNFMTNKCEMCSNTFILSWNHTCITNCTVPYILEGVGIHQVCKTPCQANNTFMFWNDQCADNCDSPLVKRIEGNAKFCDYPCDFTGSQYLYVNGSCLTSCDFFPRTVGASKFCDSCPGGSFLYPNSSCLSACDLPRISQGKDGYNFCVSPCENNEYYSKKKAKCVPICKYPNKVEDTIFCVQDVSEEAKKALNTLSIVLQSASHVSNITVTLSRILSFSNPAAALFGSLGDLIMFIRYLNINYPPKLQYILDLPQSEGIFQKLLSIPEVIENRFVQRDLPEQFQKNAVLSSFFVNSWYLYLELLIIIAIIIIILLLDGLLKRCQSLHKILLGVKQIFKWNFFISSCICYFGDLAFSTYIELKTVIFDSFWSSFSFGASIITNILALALVMKMIFISMEMVAAKKQDSGRPNSKRLNLKKNKWEAYQVVFESFKDDALIQQAFLSLFLIKLYFFNIIITSLFEHPLIQTILLTIISLFMISYLVSKRPFKETKNFIENIVQESALLVINICVLIMASLDYGNYDAFDAREVLGNIILGINTGFSVLGSLYLNFQLLLSLKNYCFSQMKNRKKDKKVIDAPHISKVEIEDINEDNPSKIESFDHSNLKTDAKTLISSQKIMIHTKIRRNNLGLERNDQVGAMEFSSIENTTIKSHNNPEKLQTNRFDPHRPQISEEY